MDSELKINSSIKANDFLADVQEMCSQLPDDQGLMEISYPDGGQYIGQIKEGSIRHGKGFYRYPNKDVYFGDWVNDTFNGKGKPYIT